MLVVGRALFGAFASMEWIALLASLAAAVAAFVDRGQGDAARCTAARTALVVPVGLILVAAVAVVWDFSTSGLEMGLVWLWIAASWYVLVARRPRSRRDRRRASGSAFGVVLGLAPAGAPRPRAR